MVNLSLALKTAVKAAKKAGEISGKDFMKAQTPRKKSRVEFVTDTDIKCEKAIIKIIKHRFPEHSIWSEERPEEKHNSEYKWVVDPLDGTHNFMKYNAVYGHSIALAKNGKTVLGVIFFPVLGQLYTGVKGKGVFLNRKKLRVSRDGFAGGVGACFFQSMKDRHFRIFRQLLRKGLDIRILGSACYHFCLVASGGYAVYVDRHLKPGDIAAGAFFVEEAGGRVTDDKNREWGLNTKNIVASNRISHAGIVGMLRRFNGL